jgi:hypothetical protein
MQSGKPPQIDPLRPFCQIPFHFLRYPIQGAIPVELQGSHTQPRIKIPVDRSRHEELARKVAQHDEEIAFLFDRVRALLEPPEPKKKYPIGFVSPQD